MNRLAKRIWKHTWVSDSVGIVFTDEAGRFERFNMPDDQNDLMCRLFDISKTHKAMSYGCIPIPKRGESVNGGFTTSWCSCIQVCKDECAGRNGYDIDAELVEAFVVCNGGTIDYSNVDGKEAS
jgi:hypothetical protein